MQNIRSLPLLPVGGDPAEHELNSHAAVSAVGVAVLDPVPDLFTAGAERTTCVFQVTQCKLIQFGKHPTSKPACFKAAYWSRTCATAQPSSLVRTTRRPRTSLVRTARARATSFDLENIIVSCSSLDERFFDLYTSQYRERAQKHDFIGPERSGHSYNF